ncbi:MAG: hypothetical protein HY574_12325 [candidate division NC10 bacterium]|nr:hypothetical protein [candidate division NC10 bacterium]
MTKARERFRHPCWYNRARAQPPPVVDFYDRHPINEGQVLEALRLLAKALDLPVSRHRIAAGNHARFKTIRVAATSAQTIRAKFCDLLEGPRR